MTSLLPPHEHGGDGARLASALGVSPVQILDLSASLNPVAPDVAEVIGGHLDALGRYPDTLAATAALAAALDVDSARLLLTNGGAEAIAITAIELGAGWVQQPEFSLYERHLPALDPDGPRFRSNPHNPTGRLADPEDGAAVWDEAFWPLSTGTWTRGDAARGSIVLGSLTKLLACPGLRVGYVLCPDPGWCERLAARQPRWAVNGLVAEALPELLSAVDLPGWAAAVAVLRERLATVLSAHGYRPQPSDANWLLVDAPELRDGLAAHGILVRDCASFGLPGTVRLAVPDPAGLDRLDAALTRLGCDEP